MGFHAKHNHERLHAQEKRDSHGTNLDNKLRFIHRAGVGAVKNEANDAVETVYSQVYVTMPNTYTGDVVWITATGTESPVPAPTQAVNSAAQASAAAAYESAKSIQHQGHKTDTLAKGSPLTQSAAPSETAAKGSPIQAAVTSNSPSAAKGSPLSASSTSKSDELIAHKEGMSGGAKAGVAFGVIIALAMVAGLVFFCWRRRKNQVKNGEQLDEKHASQNSFFSGTAAAMGAAAGNMRNSVQSIRSTHSASTAPRLSLRPVTQFLPNIMGGNRSELTGNSLTVPAMSEKPKSGWERRPHNATQDPFTDAAMLSEKQARPESPPSNPFEDSTTAAGAKAQSTPAHSAQASVDMGTPKVGTASAVAVGGAQGRQPNNVHRVQLEFKPSMDDELELISGQLVRMLHEYDDGWALCIRMDRSQQGVCPRTCLSKLPVKPRPQGPPPQGQNGRAMGPPPQGMRGPGPRPQGKDGMMPRPLTPTGRERSSTGPRAPPPVVQEAHRTRSQSVTEAASPVSPIDGGMPARKPVPGQAM